MLITGNHIGNDRVTLPKYGFKHMGWAELIGQIRYRWLHKSEMFRSTRPIPGNIISKHSSYNSFSYHLYVLGYYKINEKFIVKQISDDEYSLKPYVSFDYNDTYVITCHFRYLLYLSTKMSGIEYMDIFTRDYIFRFNQFHATHETKEITIWYENF